MPDHSRSLNNRGASTWSQKWALVTGASAGIGWALAEQLAAGGANLVLTARRADRLQELAKDLSAKHGIKVEVFAADLLQPQAPQEIHAFTQGKNIQIELLVNNAGFGAFGYIHQIPESRLMEMIQVNCSTVVHLTRLYIPAMIERRRGDILIVASTAAFQAVPFNSAYAATKAFDLIFAEGIAEELRPFGVRVCALCPGPTTTEFQRVADQPDRVFKVAETAEKVARVGLEGLAQGKTCVISGTMNRLMMESERLAPRRFIAKMAAKMMRPSDS
ncbi:MAG TPA: SDR family oxidoreductase [Candidatus Acidoferrales bacterium]|nr:SDR family oxidoreductase [Candidatus Acidoferrales bacterium]